MLIISRKDAAAAGEGQYFTGKPCKYGHIATRYTQSGTCSVCVSTASAATRSASRQNRAGAVALRQSELEKLSARRQAKVDAIKSLNTIKIPAHARDVATVFDTAVELCLAAYPCLDRSDVLPDRVPLKGLPLYRVHVPAEQEQLLRDIADALYQAHGVDVSHMAERVAAQVEQLADAEASEPPEGWR